VLIDLSVSVFYTLELFANAFVHSDHCFRPFYSKLRSASTSTLFRTEMLDVSLLTPKRPSQTGARMSHCPGAATSSCSSVSSFYICTYFCFLILLSTPSSLSSYYYICLVMPLSAQQLVRRGDGARLGGVCCAQHP
jgi:hypothetical protein